MSLIFLFASLTRFEPLRDRSVPPPRTAHLTTFGRLPRNWIGHPSEWSARALVELSLISRGERFRDPDFAHPSRNLFPRSARGSPSWACFRACRIPRPRSAGRRNPRSGVVPPKRHGSETRPRNPSALSSGASFRSRWTPSFGCCSKEGLLHVTPSTHSPISLGLTAGV